MTAATRRRVRSQWTARPARWALVLVVLSAVGAASQGLAAASGTDARPPGQGTLVRRTAYGIPHILAADYRGLGLGAGYAFAEDNLCLFADTVVTLSAQRSRWFGAEASTTYGVNNLDSDLYHRWVNRSGVVERLLAQPAPLGPSRQARDLARGYAAGYNRYLAETTVAGLPDAACRGARWVRPITELDVWRRAYQVADLGGGEALQDFVAETQPPGAQTTAGPPAPSAADGLARLRPEGIGSNGYALGRQATTGRTGMVLANPHFPWIGDQRFYQMQLTIPGELNVSGVGLPGVPMVSIGHTDRLAWTHTSSTAQSLTLTRLTLAPGDPRSYLVDGQVRPMQRDTVTVTVRQRDGSLAPVSRTLYHTADGPMVALPGTLDWTPTTAYALRDPNATNLRAIDQWLAMARARDVTELRAAQARLLGMPWVNTIAADASGTAYYGDVQVVPHVTDELLARCAIGPAIGLVILDGSRSTCGWGSDPDAVEPGLLGPSRLPTLFRQDYASNMNDSPWLANPAAPLTGYPAIVGDVGTERSSRTRLGLDMIADRLDGSDGLGPAGFTLPSLQATMLGNRNLTAEQGRAAIAAMCSANPTLTATDGRSVDVWTACTALAGWNGRGDLDARGAILWRTFIEHLRQQQVNAWLVPFDPADPTHTPRGFDASRPAVRQTFADTVQTFNAAGVPVDGRLGDFQHYAGVPIHGCNENEGCFNNISVNLTPGTDGAIADVNRGSSFIMAVELTPAGPRTRTILTYGQSVNPASPHHTDQTRLYSAKQWVTGRFTDAEIARDPALTARQLTG
jgi:acyl-homoserine-lactone acylase